MKVKNYSIVRAQDALLKLQSAFSTLADSSRSRMEGQPAAARFHTWSCCRGTHQHTPGQPPYYCEPTREQEA